MLGTSIAHYKISAKLGQGGMGEVYRATDTKLDREVAIKVLPQSVVQDKERLARFEREAKTLAQLNHSSIAGVYGLEQSGDTQALILELVEGEDLSARLKHGALPVDEALEVCKQIGDALAAAHAKGIIHRDLKPGNIKLTTEGKVKVLDFGLAKALSDNSDTSHVSSLEDSPTITDAFTQPGTILGTAAYMSPEQARGKHVDKRTDIWAFGCVLYECLTGKKAFQGEDVTDTLAKIIQGAPDWTMLPKNTPATVQLLAKKCLVKDRKKRQQHIDDAIVDLEQAISDPSTSIIQLSGQALAESNKTKVSSGTWIAYAGTLLLGFAVAWMLKPEPPSPPEQKTLASDILLPHQYPITQYNHDNGFAISRNGDFVIYNLHDSSGGLYRHDLITGNDVKISGAQGKDREGHAFLSHDGAKLGMIIDNDQLVTVPVTGGTPKTIFTEDISWGGFGGADWSKDNKIVFGQYNRTLRLIDSEGGDPVTITDSDTGDTQAYPQFLPGERYVLFTVIPGLGGSGSTANHAEVVDIQTGERAEIGVRESDFAMYVQSGHLLYSLGSDVYAIGFDLETMKAKGSAVKVLEHVDTNNTRPLLDVSDDGTLVYLESSGIEEKLMTLAWIDKHNQLEAFTQESGDWGSFSLSPDEKSVAILQAGDIYLLTKQDGDFETFQPLVKDGFRNSSPVWSHDGKSIYYWSDRGHEAGVYNIKPDFINAPKLVLKSERQAYPDSATSDFLYVSLLPRPTWDIARLVLNSPEPKLEVIPWLSDSKNAEGWPQISPDGQYIFFSRTIQGEEGVALWVSAIENPALNIITESGLRPRWSKSGSGVYYLWNNSIFRIPITYEGNQMIRLESELFCTAPERPVGFGWDISKDDSRALILIDKRFVKNNLEEEGSPPSPTHLKIKTHWFTELNRLVPLENN